MQTPRKQSILVVDDEQVVCASCDSILSEFGFHVETRTDPFEGFQLAKEKDYVSILLDLRMDGMDGIQFLDRLREENITIPVIIITAYGTLESAVRATKLGAYDFLPKPFTPDELHSVVSRAVTHLEMVQRAERAEEEKRQLRFDFIRVLAHELKAPLNAIQGYLDVLENRLQAKERDMINRCVQRLGGMRKLISDLLDLTRIESGQKKQDICKFDCAALVEKVMEAVNPEVESRGIHITCLMKRPFPIVADPTDIEMIWNNLISNAVKYNKDKGSIIIRLSRSDEEIILEVEDTGIGLEPEETERLFQEFSRIRNIQTAHILGSGLGLSIVKKLAKLYEGDVTIRSESGKGSTFTVKLREKSIQLKESKNGKDSSNR